MKEIEALIAIGLYKSRTENIRESLKGLLSKYHVEPLHEIRDQLDEQVKKNLSGEIIKIREDGAVQKLKEYVNNQGF